MPVITDRYSLQEKIGKMPISPTNPQQTNELYDLVVSSDRTNGGKPVDVLDKVDLGLKDLTPPQFGHFQVERVFEMGEDELETRNLIRIDLGEVPLSVILKAQEESLRDNLNPENNLPKRKIPSVTGYFNPGQTKPNIPYISNVEQISEKITAAPASHIVQKINETQKKVQTEESQQNVNNRKAKSGLLEIAAGAYGIFGKMWKPAYLFNEAVRKSRYSSVENRSTGRAFATTIAAGALIAIVGSAMERFTTVNPVVALSGAGIYSAYFMRERLPQIVQKLILNAETAASLTIGALSGINAVEVFGGGDLVKTMASALAGITGGLISTAGAFYLAERGGNRIGNGKENKKLKKSRRESVSFKIDRDILYVDIKDFDTKTAAGVEKSLNEARKNGITNVIFDLTECGGGNVVSLAKTLTNSLGLDFELKTIENGKVASKYFSGNLSNGLYGFKTAVMTGNNTASCAEAFTQELKKNGALQIGEKTYGKDQLDLYDLKKGKRRRRISVTSYDASKLIPDREVTRSVYDENGKMLSAEDHKNKLQDETYKEIRKSQNEIKGNLIKDRKAKSKTTTGERWLDELNRKNMGAAMSTQEFDRERFEEDDDTPEFPDPTNTIHLSAPYDFKEEEFLEARRFEEVDLGQELYINLTTPYQLWNKDKTEPLRNPVTGEILYETQLPEVLNVENPDVDYVPGYLKRKLRKLLMN